MNKRITITLDQEILEYVDSKASNRSSWINKILKEKQQQELMEQLEEGYKEMSNNPEIREEIELWDSVVGDGLDNA
jgi:metal-responsive CopG/Arc/MetJ family transcriptional regulator